LTFDLSTSKWIPGLGLILPAFQLIQRFFLVDLDADTGQRDGHVKPFHIGSRTKVMGHGNISESQ